MPKLIDLTGQRFGRLTVISRAGSSPNGGHARWNCLCDCGKSTIVSAPHLLRSKSTSSCGCIVKENTREVASFGGLNHFKRAKNSNPPSNNKSGVKGVFYDKGRKIWKATLMMNNENKLYKCFKTKEEAIQARKEAEEKYLIPYLNEQQASIDKIKNC